MPTARLGISLGDPTGIGPEVVVRALAERPDREAVLYGDRGVVERAAAASGVTLPPRVQVVGVTGLALADVPPGQPNEIGGRAQIDYLAAATDAALSGEVAALVTAPISKDWAARAGFPFPGHTEYLARRAGVDEFAMMFVGRSLRVTIVTRHLPLREVPGALSVASIASAVMLTARALRREFALPFPKVAVAGLNPHAGEAGRFGDEEQRLVVPAIGLAQRRLEAAGVVARVSGPHVPDAVFRQAAHGEFDAVVALYHDQGLIPIKLVEFEDAVNLTVGLPFVRTSPDHGTGYDIAGTGRARPRSFLAALDLAADLVEKAAGRTESD